MTNQLLQNEQRLREYGQQRYQDLQREADRERLADKPPKKQGRQWQRYGILAPVTLGLGLLLAQLIQQS